MSENPYHSKVDLFFPILDQFFLFEILISGTAWINCFWLVVFKNLHKRFISSCILDKLLDAKIILTDRIPKSSYFSFTNSIYHDIKVYDKKTHLFSDWNVLNLWIWEWVSKQRLNLNLKGFYFEASFKILESVATMCQFKPTVGRYVVIIEMYSLIKCTQISTVLSYEKCL